MKRVIPFKHCARVDADAYPDGAQGFLMRVEVDSDVIYFDEPVGWAMIDDELVNVSAVVSCLPLGTLGWHRVLVCGLRDVVPSFDIKDVALDGWCYLSAYDACLRRIKASEHGRFPKFADVASCVEAVKPVELFDYGHSVHVEPGGDRIMTECVVAPEAVVGGLRSGFVRDEWNSLRGVIEASKPDVMLVYLHTNGPSWRPVRVDRSRVYDVPVVDTRVNGEWSPSLVLTTSDTAAVMLPRGVRLVHDGVTYGCDAVRVYAVFRGDVSLDFLPTLGRYVQGDPDLPVTVVSSADTSLSDKFRECIEYNGTFARFVRQMRASVVFSLPDDVASAGVSCGEAVHVSDPLHFWRAIDYTRYDMTQPGPAILDFNGSVLHAVRSSVPDFRLVVDGAVGITAGAAVSLPAAHVLRAESASGVRYSWSIRVARLVDEYCMDRGGPSDGEFSDAI